MADPLATLRGTIRTAADSLGDGAADSIAPTLERPPKREPRGLLYERRDAAGSRPWRAAAPDRQAAGRGPGNSARRHRGARRGRRPGIRQSLPRRPLVPGERRRPAGRRRRIRAGGAEPAGAGADRVRVRESHRASPRGERPARGVRRRARPDPRLRRARGRARVLPERHGPPGAAVRESIAARMRGDEPPEDGYRGEYVVELAEQLRAAGADPNDAEGLARLGNEAMRERIDATLDRFGVGFDTWSSERSVYESGSSRRPSRPCGRAATCMRARARSGCGPRLRGRQGSSDRAVGRRAHLLRPGHRLPLRQAQARRRAPHRRPRRRSPRIRPQDAGGARGTGRDPDKFEAQMIQMVHLELGGERTQMSKRQGTFVTLDELLDDIGIDATRFFMLQRSHETTVDLDLELARSQSQDNPVYYVQYAHARIASILRKARAEGAAPAGEGDGVTRGPSLPPRPRRSGRPRSQASGRWCSGSSSFPPRRAPPASAARRTAWPHTRRRQRRTSTPSTAIARSSGRARGWRRRAWACGRREARNSQDFGPARGQRPGADVEVAGAREPGPAPVDDHGDGFAASTCGTSR